jgi:hypothetical protein
VVAVKQGGLDGGEGWMIAPHYGPNGLEVLVTLPPNGFNRGKRERIAYPVDVEALVQLVNDATDALEAAGFVPAE